MNFVVEIYIGSDTVEVKNNLQPHAQLLARSGHNHARLTQAKSRDRVQYSRKFSSTNIFIFSHSRENYKRYLLETHCSGLGSPLSQQF